MPEPLPPEDRTVGQLVAETIRLYGAKFWPALAIGVPVALANALTVELAGGGLFYVVPVVTALLLPLSYVGAVALASGEPFRGAAARNAYVVGTLVFLPYPLLASVFVLPGIVWLALVGLAVPAALVERLDVRASLRRGLALARADLVHAIGSFGTFYLLVLLCQFGLFLLLRAQGEQTARIAAFLAGIVVNPLLFLGAALLYYDQEARSRIRRR